MKNILVPICSVIKRRTAICVSVEKQEYHNENAVKGVNYIVK